MSKKVLYTLEYPVRCSPSILYDFLSTPAGLQEWFADKVDERDNIFSFTWNETTDKAELVSSEIDKSIRYHWLHMPKDEYFELTKLNSFDSIAKECRKYGLFLCIATQMPRDIPIGTLSQIGTFIVHRLINHFDKEAIANASSSANKSSLDFLPILGSGEALLMGVDFPMPVILKIDKPNLLPDSATPQFI